MKAGIELNFSTLMTVLSPRKKDAYKGDFGCVVVVGGNAGMVGAPILAAQACYRVGAGRVKVVTRPEYAFMATMICPEIQSFGVATAEQLEPIIEKATVLVVGPGLGQDAWANAIAQELLQSNLPTLVDADALHLLAAQPHRRDNWILTPHLGEAAALLYTTTLALKSQQQEAVISMQAQYGGVAVLKGAPTWIAVPNGKTPFFCAQGNPGMATAGMGDVLSGVIAGLLAQGVSLEAAAKLGVVLHAKAGDSAAKQGARGMIASDLFPYLRKWVS